MNIIKKIKKWLWWKGITLQDLAQGVSAVLLLMGAIAFMLYLVTMNVFS